MEADSDWITPLELKFNSGRGALLCVCHKVMAEGFVHAGKVYECKCGSLHQIVDCGEYFGVINY